MDQLNVLKVVEAGETPLVPTNENGGDFSHVPGGVD